MIFTAFQVHDLLMNPPEKPAIRGTAGLLDPPLGSTRLNIAKFLAVLLSTNNMTVNEELKKLNTVDALLVSGGIP